MAKTEKASFLPRKSWKEEKLVVSMGGIHEKWRIL